jgi:hypothetical protein
VAEEEAVGEVERTVWGAGLLAVLQVVLRRVVDPVGSHLVDHLEDLVDREVVRQGRTDRPRNPMDPVVVPLVSQGDLSAVGS